MVNNQITSQDLDLPEPSVTSPLQVPPELNAMVEDITSNVLGKMTQESTVNAPELIDVDPHVPAGSDTETIDYIENGYIGDMLPKESGSPLPESVLDSLGRISPININSSPRQDDELLPKIPQNDVRPTVMIENEDVDFTLSRTIDRVEINPNNDDDVTFVKQTPQHPRCRLARMLQDETSRIEVDAEVLEAYLLFSANITLDETNKDKKKEEIFNKIMNQLPPDNTIYTDHDKKTNTYKVR